LPPASKVNLITVPSCSACNNAEADNDNYFRDALAVMASDENDGLPSETRQEIVRSMAKAGNRYRPPMRVFLETSKPVWRSFGDSTLLSRGHMIPVRWDRIKRTIDRTTLGLYWRHRGTLVPDGFDNTIIGDKERQGHGWYQTDLFRDMALDTLKGTRHIVHPSVFMYAANFASEDPRIGAFLLCFYKRVLFLSLVGPIEVPSPIVFPALA
jgi:hypothetical protein